MFRHICSEGYWCPASSPLDKALDQQCTPFQACPPQSATPTECVAGQWQLSPGQGECLECPHGYYCPGKTVPGPPLAWGDAGVATTVTFSDLVQMAKCDPGYYCEAGSTTPTEKACPPGTFQPNEGAKSVDECQPSPPGFYQELTAAIIIDTAKTCTAGYFCALGSFTPTPDPATDGASIPATLPYPTAYGDVCPIGYYCPTGTPSKICCPPGKRCTATQLAAPDNDCDAGKYCPRCTSGTGVICPAGYYCELNSGEPV